MNEQPKFLVSTKPAAAVWNLFLAVFPDRWMAEFIYHHLAPAVRRRRGMTGRLRPLDHLHISLCGIGYDFEVSESDVQAVEQACETVAARMPPFEVRLDRVASFRNRSDNHPLVLIGCDDGNAALRRLHEVLLTELANHVRLEGRNLPFNPHLTMLYDKKRLAAEDFVEAVSWRVGEIVLVRSEVGDTKHQRLARWTLGG